MDFMQVEVAVGQQQQVELVEPVVAGTAVLELMLGKMEHQVLQIPEVAVVGLLMAFLATYQVPAGPVVRASSLCDLRL
jgi:hypothetical protein